MAETTVKKKQLNEIIGALSVIDYLVKNIFTIRAEKLLKKLNELVQKINEEIQDVREENAVTDDKGNFVLEALTETEKNGKAKTQNIGNYKYTHERAKKRDAAIEIIMNADIDIPTYLITRHETNAALYKEIFKKYSPSTITSLAGILLDVPLDEDNFVKEEFVIEMTTEPKAEANGQQKETVPAV